MSCLHAISRFGNRSSFCDPDSPPPVQRTDPSLLTSWLEGCKGRWLVDKDFACQPLVQRPLASGKGRPPALRMRPVACQQLFPGHSMQVAAALHQIWLCLIYGLQKQLQRPVVLAVLQLCCHGESHILSCHCCLRVLFLTIIAVQESPLPFCSWCHRRFRV